MPPPALKPNPEESERLVKEAMEEFYNAPGDKPKEHKPDPRNLLAKLLTNCGSVWIENTGLRTLADAVADGRFVSYEMMDRLANAFGLPETIAINRRTPEGEREERVAVKDFFYELFDYVDKRNEAKIQERIDKVFDDNTRYPDKYTIVTLVRALMWASGWFGINSDVGGVNEMELSCALGYGKNVLSRELQKTEITYNFLSQLIGKERNVLHLNNGDEKCYFERVDALFAKNNHMTHWRKATLHANALRILPELEAGCPPFRDAVRRLLPEDYVESGELGHWMQEMLGRSGDFDAQRAENRARSLLNGTLPIPAVERDAIIKVVGKHTGIEPEGLVFLEGLNTEKKEAGNEAFSKKTLEMLKRYINQRWQGEFSLQGSCKTFVPLTGPDPKAFKPLHWTTIKSIAKQNHGVTLQSARGIVTGFDRLQEQLEEAHSHLAAPLKKDVEDLLATTVFTREGLLYDANQVVEHFDENAEWPVSARKTRIGQLLDDVRSSRGLDISAKDLAELSEPGGGLFHSLAAYLSRNDHPIPIREEKEPPPEHPDVLRRIVNGINAGLKANEQPELTSENIEKIRRVAVKSHAEFKAHEADIEKENAKRARERAGRAA